MNEFAAWINEMTMPRQVPAALRNQFSFLGENNIKNKSAVKNLMTMAKSNKYVYCGSKSGLESILPGVKIDVLGPPTVNQTDTIKNQRSKDPNEFWHLAARMARTAESNGGKPPPFSAKSM